MAAIVSDKSNQLHFDTISLKFNNTNWNYWKWNINKFIGIDKALIKVFHFPIFNSHETNSVSQTVISFVTYLKRNIPIMIY